MANRSLRIALLGVLACSISRGQADVAVGDVVDGHPFRRYSAQDAFDRTVHFYVSEAPDTDTPAPLVVFVQGTGCSSHFTTAGRRILAGLPSLLHQVVGSRTRVLAVEKPGVEYLDDQGDRSMQEACRPQFAREHTLERWTEAIAAVIRASRRLPRIDASRTMVVGISEGAIVAVRVSNVEPAVTHAAALSGGGPNHLFVLADYVRKLGLDPEQEVFTCWERVRAEPNSATKFCLDHPYRHWASFYSTSLVAESLESAAKLYVVHGSEDRQNSIQGFDVLRAELAAKGRPAVFERLEGAGHSLDMPGQETPEGLRSVFGRLNRWFHESR